MKRFDTRWIPQKKICAVKSKKEFSTRGFHFQKRNSPKENAFLQKGVLKNNFQKRIFLLGEKEYIYM